MRLTHTTGSEDTLIEAASEHPELIAGLLDILERLDGIIDEKNKDIDRMEDEQSALKEEVESLKEQLREAKEGGAK